MGASRNCRAEAPEQTELASQDLVAKGPNLTHLTRPQQEPQRATVRGDGPIDAVSCLVETVIELVLRK